MLIKFIKKLSIIIRVTLAFSFGENFQIKKAELPKCNYNAVTFGNPAILSEGSSEKPESEVERKTRGYL